MSNEERLEHAKARYEQLQAKGWNAGIIREYLKGPVSQHLPLLRLENVSNKWLKNINLELYPGEIFGLLGLGGAGKTTLLRAIVGGVSYNGRILVKEEDSGDLIPFSTSSSLAKTLIGFSPQYNSFYPELSVRENLIHFALLYGYGQEQAKTIVNQLINVFGLQNFAEQQAGDLSPGLKKHLDIASALVHEPKLLVLDEPAADLDVVSQQRLWQLLQKLRDQGTTILVSFHHTFGLERFCDRIGILHKGKLVKTGTFLDIAGPFLHIYELFLQTKKENYDLLAQAFENLGYGIRRTDQGLIVYTDRPEKTLQEAGTLIQHYEDTLLDIRLLKPGIEQFIQALAYHE